MRQSEEDKIVAGSMRGDKTALNQLVEQNKGLVYALAFHRVRNYDDARDIAQNVFVSVVLNIHRLDDLRKFKPWLHRITINACNAFIAGKPTTAQVDRMLTAPNKIPALMTKLAVEQALSCLSEQTRLILTLFYFGSYSHAEIASFLEIPSTSVKSRLRDGRLRLKKEMLEMVEHEMQGIALGADFNEQVAALAEASVRGNADKAQELLSLDKSLAHGYGKVADEHVEYMKTENADDGWTPLHLAAHYGHLDIVKILLDCGADIDAVSKNSIANTPISAAAWGNRLDIVEYLIERGANMNAPNAWGSTALHRAIDADREELAGLLLVHGADPNIKNATGQTPLDIAEEHKNGHLCELLRRYQ